MRRRDVPDRDTYFRRWSDLHLGYDPRQAAVPRAWLTLTYFCARPLARRWVPPNLVTLAGGAASALVPVLAWLGGGWWLLAGVAVVVASGLLDSLDGAVAALTDRATALGYVLDSMVDRVSEGCYLIALWLLGAPAWLCVLGGFVTMLQEYVRARAGNAGLAELGVLTVAERPSRVIVTSLAIGGAAVLRADAEWAATAGVAAWLAIGTLGLLQLAAAVRRGPTVR